jgi:hypothetical protein
LFVEWEGWVKHVEYIPGIRNISTIMTTKDEGRKETVLNTQA